VVKTFRQASNRPTNARRKATFGADDFLILATDQEGNGELPAALKTYERGLVQFPDSIALNRAAGRLEVALKENRVAVQHLSKALARVSSDHEAAYYLGQALAAEGDDRAARIHWEFAQQSGSYHAAAMMALAALESREGQRERALRIVQELVSNRPDLIQAGGMEVCALARTAASSRGSQASRILEAERSDLFLASL